jgi:hypothetical protein
LDRRITLSKSLKRNIISLNIIFLLIITTILFAHNNFFAEQTTQIQFYIPSSISDSIYGATISYRQVGTTDWNYIDLEDLFDVGVGVASDVIEVEEGSYEYVINIATGTSKASELTGTFDAYETGEENIVEISGSYSNNGSSRFKQIYVYTSSVELVQVYHFNRRRPPTSKR